MTRFVAFLLLFALILTSGTPLHVAAAGAVPRFLMLNEGLYRGGQPTQAGFEFLKRQGFKTVVNLRAEDNRESEVVQRLGMNYIQIPVDEVLPWSQLPEAAIAKYFEIVNNPANYPIFFHCKRGADRTGAMAALYRMAVQGWGSRKAYDEALDIGMRWYYAGLKSQIYDFHRPTRVEDLQTSMKKQ